MEQIFEESLRVLKQDAYFRPLIKKYGPPDLTTYHKTETTAFSALLRSIIYQQLSGRAAGAIYARVLDLFPHETPTPADLLKIRKPSLRKAGLSIAKIDYVRDLARKCLDGTIDEMRFPQMSSQEIIDHVTQVHGIGEWTAHMLLIFTLYRSDVLPVGDLAIRKGFQKLYNMKSLPTKKEMQTRAMPWASHASIASWYLWKLVDEDASV